jgi:hypothetical protein
MKREMLAHPMPVVEGYVIDLYCKYKVDDTRHFDYWGVTFSGHSRAKARQDAKNSGWKFHRDGTATCPMCARTAP